MLDSGNDEDRKLISASIAELDDYLNSQVMFWRIPRQRLMLTPGNLLLALLCTSQDQVKELISARDTISKLTEKRRVAWEEKVLKEIPLRLNQWKGYMEDYREGGTIDPNFPYSVRVRVIITLLIAQARFVSPKFITQLDELDSSLNRLAIPGGFIWPTELGALFPQSTYPFLYLHPKGESK
jgi:hypothetical protein